MEVWFSLYFIMRLVDHHYPISQSDDANSNRELLIDLTLEA